MQLVMQLFFLNFSCFNYLFPNKNNPIVIFIFDILLTLLFPPRDTRLGQIPKDGGRGSQSFQSRVMGTIDRKLQSGSVTSAQNG